VQAARSIGELCGLRLDYVGAKDPQDTVDGVVHNRAGELQRVIRCNLPERFWFNGQSLLLEMLFADLSQFNNARFQVIFPEADGGRRKEMIVVASYLLAKSGHPGSAGNPPMLEMQSLLERLLERLITLGIAPKVMNAIEVRQLISGELGSRATKSQLNRDWRNIGNLGWEPSFRDMVLKPSERFMQVADRRSITLAVEQLPASGSFEWLSAVLADIPEAHVSMFISSWSAQDPLSKMAVNQKLKKHSVDAGLVNPVAAQMSFFFRFEGRDAYQLEADVSTARKYFASLGINNSSVYTQRQQQLQNWRSTLPCAQEQASNKHLIAFMRSQNS
jgi:hypothetical protein